MPKYYMINNSLFENIGHETFQCVASKRNDMIGVMIIKPNLNKPQIIPVENKGEALYWMKEDAYQGNYTLYTMG